MKRPMRVAFCGASGTGKTTLARFVAERYGLEVNPVGSRSVASEMGFSSPYDVDAAGKRSEFQARLFAAKIEWEIAHASFVTDRTPFDNLAYTLMHSGADVTEDLVDRATRHARTYTAIFFCPIDWFCDVETDAARVSAMPYQRAYEAVLTDLVHREKLRIRRIDTEDLGVRKRLLAHWLDP